MKRFTREYAVNHVNIRISNELYNILREACYDLGVTIQSAVTSFVLFILDPEEKCPDWECIPDILH